MRFLNTEEETSMGVGVDLEVGNTIYFDMPPGQFSYWNTTDEYREKIRTLIRSGHIDCIHSFGDLATTRAHAKRALDELQKHDCRIRVWVDHAQAPTNFGSDIMRGHGDETGHPAYHADLTMDYGIEYVWSGRVTSVIGQGCSFSLGGVANWSRPLGSIKTLAKQSVKQVLAGIGVRKYKLHHGNRLCAEDRLRDGSSVKEFIRCNPHWSGISGSDRGDCIDDVLTKKFLDRLARRGGACILYTHLGKLDRNLDREMLSERAIAAFRTLAEYRNSGKIRVLTTTRLLDEITSSAALVAEELRFPSLALDPRTHTKL
jgi:hypothetical protein